jgi:murein DD-endopeptidase MepM/ murein hydrolase activator NlpD
MVSAAVLPHVSADATIRSGLTSSLTSNRAAAVDRADRSTNRLITMNSSVPDVWMLPMMNYTVGSPFGQGAGVLARGVDLNAPEGTAFYAAHGGTVRLARWNGGYGYTVIIDAGSGVELVYGHASQLLVHEGQRVNSGDILALTGSTGYAFSPHVHFEIRVHGQSMDAAAYLLAHGVNLTHHTDALS